MTDIRQCKYEGCKADISHRHKLTIFCTEECKRDYNRGGKSIVVKKPKVEKIPVLPYVYSSKYYDK